MARRRLEVEPHTTAPVDPAIINSFQRPTAGVVELPSDLKFPAPATPLQQMKSRHDPIVTQLTNLMMWDGKKAKRKRHGNRPLHPAHKSRSNLRPQTPTPPWRTTSIPSPAQSILYLTLATDSVAPLLPNTKPARCCRWWAGAADSRPAWCAAEAETGFHVDFDAASKKGDRMRFPERVAQEIISVVEGRSGVWERRAAVHKLGTAARTSLGWGGKGWV